ncbi:hypothetical protein FA13DRAFT_450518 [Coprinellus micaceus]|uniref:PH domain-containing protein n=1 Tax=Coprinellus micaceus TaxID=71717 RepID=A0A4Y7TYB5_COPMI|nr:hypothetical protein FA13DRAFT_450518 [Coprinellus micaceus]
MKALSTQEYEQWMTSLRIFMGTGSEARSKRSASVRMMNSARQGSFNLNRTGDIVDEMGDTIKALEQIFTELEQGLSLSPPNMSRDASTSSRKSEKDKHHREMFGLFRKHSSENQSDLAAQHQNAILYKDLRKAIDTLKTQHTSLTKVVQEPLSAAPRSLPNTVVEEAAHSPRAASPRSPFAPFKYPHPHRASYAASVTSDGELEWFDAEDRAEEFHFDTNDSPPTGVHEEQPSQTATTIDATSMFEDHDSDDDSSIDTDLGVDEPTEIISPGVNHLRHAYRTQLPAPPPEDEGSLFTILKKNVGKDLSTITFPVTFNEPLSLLQRTAEEMEYWDLLNQAASSADPVTRISYVAAFAVSGYAHTRHRSGRKGFNPMLAETFEDVRMKFIAEKVQHNPVEMAYHAEGQGWELTALSAGRTKFWGKSLEIIPSGTTRVKIGTDLYVWTKPSSFMRNLMVGTKYIDHCGKMAIENVTTGMRCVLDFKQNGYWGPSNVVSGTVHGSDGGIVGQLEGKWDDQMAQILDNDHLHVLWRCSPFPKNTHEYYGFTSFGITLNEITTDIAQKLPPTDSRLRTDIRALEHGDLDTAETEKTRIEEAQRDRRRRGQDAQPMWFRKVGDEWEYAGGYWEARARGWKEPVRPLW